MTILYIKETQKRANKRWETTENHSKVRRQSESRSFLLVVFWQIGTMPLSITVFRDVQWRMWHNGWH